MPSWRRRRRSRPRTSEPRVTRPSTLPGALPDCPWSPFRAARMSKVCRSPFRSWVRHGRKQNCSPWRPGANRSWPWSESSRPNGISGQIEPTPPNGAKNGKNFTFAREIDPLPPFLMVGGGGWDGRKMLDIRAVLAFRQLRALAEGGDRFLYQVCPLTLSSSAEGVFLGDARGFDCR